MEFNEPMFQLAEAKNPQYAQLAEIQENMVVRAKELFDVKPTANQYSDEQGCFSALTKDGRMLVKMFTFSSPALDWLVALRMVIDMPIPDAAPYVVVKTFFNPNPALLTPQLVVETGAPFEGADKLLMFVSFTPTLNPFTQLEYVDKYYCKSPGPGQPSFEELENRARANSKYHYFSSKFTLNRLYLGTAISYIAKAAPDCVDEVLASVKLDVDSAFTLWASFVQQDVVNKQRLPITPEVEMEHAAMLRAVLTMPERDPHSGPLDEDIKFHAGVKRNLFKIISSEARLHSPATLAVAPHAGA